MAPRRRQKKVGLRRIDAAFDAMRPMGFSKSTIEKAVKKLLEVYGGDDGWIFIEEASYKILLDELLLPQKDQEESAMIPLEVGNQDEIGSEAVEKGGMTDASTFDEPCLSSFGPGGCSRQAIEERLEALEPEIPVKRGQPCYGWLSESD